MVSRRKGILYVRSISRFFDVKVVNCSLREVILEKVRPGSRLHRNLHSTMNSSGDDLTLATLLLFRLAKIIFTIWMILCMLKPELLGFNSPDIFKALLPSRQSPLRASYSPTTDSQSLTKFNRNFEKGLNLHNSSLSIPGFFTPSGLCLCLRYKIQRLLIQSAKVRGGLDVRSIRSRTIIIIFAHMLKWGHNSSLDAFKEQVV